MTSAHYALPLLTLLTLGVPAVSYAAPPEVAKSSEKATFGTVSDAFSIPALGPSLTVQLRQGKLEVGDKVSVHHHDGVAVGLTVNRVDPSPLTPGQKGLVCVNLDPELVVGMRDGAVVASVSSIRSTRRLKAKIRLYQVGSPPPSDPARTAEIARMVETLDTTGMEVVVTEGKRRKFSTGFTPELEFHGYPHKGSFTFHAGGPVVGGPWVPAELELTRYEGTHVGATFRIDAHGGIVGEGVVTELPD